MILQDYLIQGVPWPESRKVLYRSAPESCRMAIQGGGAFYESVPFTDAEMMAHSGQSRLDDVLGDMDSYLLNLKSGMRMEDERLLWFANLRESGGAMDFTWMDLREFQIKILFQRRFQSLYQRHEYMADQIAEVYRYYNRTLHTFRRLKSVRWVKIAVRNGVAQIYIFYDAPDGSSAGAQLLLERSFYNNRKTECELLDAKHWEEAPEHVKERINYWRHEETGDLDDDILRRAIRSEDDVLVSWAVEKLRAARDPYTRELLKAKIESDSPEESKAAIRAAGRLWLSEFESDVMKQYARIGNPVGPAVADYIGSVGVTGRSFLPTILNSLARRGDFATLISVIRALGVFPYSKEFKALPKELSLMLELNSNIESFVQRHTGIASDLRGGQGGAAQLQDSSIEALRANAVHAIIQTVAMTADEETFDAVARQFDMSSPFFLHLLEEIEINLRTDASGYIMERMRDCGAFADGLGRDPSIPRKSVLAARALMRVNKPEDRPSWLMKAVSRLVDRVESYKQDSALRYCLYIENYPSEPHVSLRSIIRGLPNENDIREYILNQQSISDKEKFLIHKISGEG